MAQTSWFRTASFIGFCYWRSIRLSVCYSIYFPASFWSSKVSFFCQILLMRTFWGVCFLSNWALVVLFSHDQLFLQNFLLFSKFLLSPVLQFSFLFHCFLSIISILLHILQPFMGLWSYPLKNRNIILLCWLAFMGLLDRFSIILFQTF
jgi:hypothetical protein